LGPLAGLAALRILSLRGSLAVVDVTPLAGLHGLQQLDVKQTGVVNLLPLQSHAGLTIRASPGISTAGEL
jgi:hypothetical protein